MGTSVAEGRDTAIEAAGDRDRRTGDRHQAASDGRDESPGEPLSLRVTEDRVLIRADRDDHAPQQTDAGIYLAKSLAAAVDGSDEADSWFTGTVVQIGPLVNKRDCRKTLVKWLLEIEEEGLDVPLAEIVRLRQKVEEMWTDMPDPVAVGRHVTFSWASGQQINVDGEKYVILRAGDVLAVLEDE